MDCGTINTKPENSLGKGSRSYITDRKAISALPGGREDEGDELIVRRASPVKCH